MTTMHIPEVAVVDVRGLFQWSGSLHRWLRDNGFHAREAREITDQLRPVGPMPPVAQVGGGAAPVFYLTLVA